MAGQGKKRAGFGVNTRKKKFPATIKRSFLRVEKTDRNQKTIDYIVRGVLIIRSQEKEAVLTLTQGSGQRKKAGGREVPDSGGRVESTAM